MLAKPRTSLGREGAAKDASWEGDLLEVTR